MSSSRSSVFLCACLLLTPSGVLAQPQERPPLPDYLEASISDAIERGKNYLMRTQGPTGTWATTNDHKFGYCALPALTLLECGVPASDPGIQRAANFFRAAFAPKEPFKDLTNTYEVSLALLFLDRLGNPKDKPAIETLAARLIGGQTHTGGWSYKVPVMDAGDSATVLRLVKTLEPLPLQHLLAGRVPNMNNPFVKREPVPDSELATKRAVKVPARLTLLPCFTQFGTFKLVDPEGKGQEPLFGTTDNSTTQFALLALWAARRHGIPCTRTGSLTFMRFHTSQNGDGSWGYAYVLGGAGGTPTMINTGLLGMAVGHGIVREMSKTIPGLKDDPPVDEDPRILNAFRALAGHIGEPQDKVKDLPYPNLYFLWGLERVCMLYNVHLVGNRDWYRWGAEALVANQDPVDGYWFRKDGYPGAAPAIDTSFALMFLKRANLAEDLSAYLAFSPKKLNEGVLKLTPPPAPKPEPKPEPPKVAETKPEPPLVTPEPPPVQVAEAKVPPPIAPAPTIPVAAPAPAPTPPAGGSAWVIWVIVGLGVLLVGGGLLVFLLMRGGGESAENDDEEDDRPRKKPPKRSRGK